jgi:hypothetical protein
MGALADANFAANIHLHGLSIEMKFSEILR